MFCENCGTENNGSSKFCKKCGKPLTEDMFSQCPENRPFLSSVVEPRETYYTSDEYKPISMWGYFGYQILFGIPIVGFICLVVISLNARNKNLKNYAASYICVIILVFLLIIVIGILIVTGIITGNVTNIISNLFKQFLTH